MKIIFALPGNHFSNNFLLAWTELFNWCIKHNIEPIMVNRYTSNVYHVRNMCLGGDVTKGAKQKPFQGNIEYDYIMWIDSDMVFSVNDFIKLLNHKKDIVSGMYLMDGGKQFTTVIDWNEDYYKKNGKFHFLTPEDIKGKEELMSVDYTGFGWILVKKNVFESMEYPWFKPLWFQFGEAENGSLIKEFCSEDVGWCKTIKKLGYEIFVDPTIIVGHEKTIVYGKS